MKDTLIMIGFYALVHAAFGAWTDNTDAGGKLKHFLQTWKTDSFLHLILCAGTVSILGVCAILAMGLGMHYLQRF